MEVVIDEKIKTLFNPDILGVIEEILIQELEYADWIDMRDIAKCEFKLSFFHTYIDAYIDGVDDDTICMDIMKISKLLYDVIKKLDL